MTFEIWILTLIWTIVGGIVCVMWGYNKNTEGWELCNPRWTYRYHTSVNWFGALVLALVYTVFCPAGALCYWFYKICTIGRKPNGLKK